MRHFLTQAAEPRTVVAHNTTEVRLDVVVVAEPFVRIALWGEREKKERKKTQLSH